MTITVQVETLSGAPALLSANYFRNANVAAPRLTDQDEYRIDNLIDPVGGGRVQIRFISTADDLTYAGSTVTGGTIDRIEFWVGTVSGGLINVTDITARVFATGYSIDAAALYQAMLNDDLTALNQLLFQADDFEFVGNIGNDSFTGGTFGDYISGDSGKDVLNGHDGHDTIRGGGGNDILDGGKDNDTVDYSSLTVTNNITVTLGAYNTKTGDAAQTKTSGVAGYADSIKNFENILGGDGDDKLTGNATDNTLDGRSGDDLLAGLGGADILDGRSGIDIISYAASKEGVTVELTQQGLHFKGDPNNARILDGDAQKGGDAEGDLLWSIEGIIGSAKDDFLSANTATGDTHLIDAGAGNDFVFASEHGEILLGGAGMDTLSFAQVTTGVDVNLAGQGKANASRNAVTGGTNNIGEAADSYSVAEFENLAGGSGDDELTGDKFNNVIEGGAGADELVGGLGTDTVSYAGSAAGVTVFLDFQGTSNADGSKDAAGNAQSGGDAAGDLLWGFENIIGSSHNDFLDGGAGPNNIQGGDGDDQIGGGVGNDVLDGGAGFDILRLNHLDDNVTATLGAYDSKTGNVAQAKTSGVKNDVDSFKNFEGIQGGNGDDKLTGNAGDNLIQGGGGSDIIQGLGGADRLEGGSGRDTVTYAASSGAVTIDFSLNDEIDPEFSGKQKGGDAEGDQLARFDILVGSKYSDILVGEAGGDDLIIDGGAGDDIIGGLATSNYIIGGTGNDTVHYGDYLGNGNDTDIDIGVTVDLQLQLTFDKSYSPIYAKGKNDSDYQQQGGNAGGNLLSGIENIVGSEGNDKLTGDKFVNILEGGQGADHLIGVGAGDKVSYADSSSGVYVNLENAFQDGLTAQADKHTDGLTPNGDAAGDILENLNVFIGSAFDDVVQGNSLKSDTLFGGGGEDDLSGGGGNFKDVLDGGDDDDNLYGGDGADTLIGGDGNDWAAYGDGDGKYTVGITITLGKSGTSSGFKASGGEATGDKLSGIENIAATVFNDALTGNELDNWLLGLDGSDTIAGLGGADVLDGNKGIDTVSYAASLAGVTVSLTEHLLYDSFGNPDSGIETAKLTAQKGGDAEGDFLLGFENVIGSKYNDVLTGNELVNILDGGAGNDLLNGNDKGDILLGGVGLDTVTYATSGAVSVSLLSQGSYNAKTGFTGPAQVGAGSDAEGDKFSGIENLIGSGNADTLIGDSKNNVIEGGDGADVLIGLGGLDTVSYESSSAGVTLTLYGASQGTTDATGKILNDPFGIAPSGGHAAGDKLYGFENIIGSGHNDELSAFDNGSSLWGLGGADRLNGEINKVDKLYGGDGDDTLNGLGGKDLLDGGAGIDTVEFGGLAYDGKSLTVTLGKNDATAAAASGGAAGLKIYAVENLTGSNGNDRFTANNEDIDNIFIGFGGNDILSGMLGDDTLEGWHGDDTLIGGEGKDTLDGGSDFDTADYSASKSAVTVNMSQQGTYIGDDPFNGRDVAPVAQTGGTGDSVGDQFWGIERVVGSAHNDVLKGDTGNFTLDGGKGDDLIIAGSGEEVLVGGLNTAVGDTLSYLLSGSGVVVSLLTQGTYNPITGLITGASAAAQSGGYAEGDFLSGFENVIGTTQVDEIRGDAKNNVIEGDNGGDTLFGGAGTDTVSYKNSVFQVTVDLTLQGTTNKDGSVKDAATAQGGGHAHGDMLYDFENIIGSDNGFNGDILIGDAKNNVITGRFAADELTGGGGNDTFVFLLASDGGDEISDFSSGDKIAISKTGFGGGLENLKSITAAYFLSGDDPGAGMTTNQHGYLLFDTDFAGILNTLYWDSDGTGGNAATLIAVFENDYVMQAKDFVLI